MNAHWSLAGLLPRAERLFGDSTAVICGGETLTYRQLAQQAGLLSAAVSRRTRGFGSRVALLHRNCHQFMATAFACVDAARVLVPVNVRLDPVSIRSILRDCEAELLICEQPFSDLARAAATPGLPIHTVGELVDATTARLPVFRSVEADDVAQIYYTSGTTGAPRGVMLTHGNIASHALMTIAELELGESDVWAHVAPMFHLADAWAVFSVTWVGGRHVMVPQFEPEEVLNEIQRRSVTLTNLVPTMLHRLVSQPRTTREDFRALRLIMSGGAPISTSLVRAVCRRFDTAYVQTYGLTETCPFLTFSSPPRDLGSGSEAAFAWRARTGRPALGVDLRVVGEDGEPVARDDVAVGEIRVRAPWVMKGYLGRPEATQAAFQDGWFRTGDLATWNERGSVNIVDRVKDVIITGGEKVYSVEVEHALLTHPAVSECAVVGIPDAEWGERVVAAVVARAGRSPSTTELQAHLKGMVAGFKIPKRITFVSELPRTGSGKLRKIALRQTLGEAS